jgi:hypothetical protein
MYEQLFFRALAVTILVETTALYFLIEKFEKIKPVKGLILFTGFISSFATLPYVWYLFPKYFTEYPVFLLTSESAVVITEAVIYFLILKFSFSRCLLFSFICNSLSLLTGLLLDYF